MATPPAPPSERQSASTGVAPAIQPTQWKKGLIIGAAIGALVGGSLANGLCRALDSGASCAGMTVGGALMLGALTGTIGAFIGGAFPKHE